MRHGKKINHLGRKAAHRRALLRNLSISLIEHKRIQTTLAKAKALRRHLEPLISKCKLNTTHSRRVVFSYLQNKEAIKELFGVISETIGDRPGGYLRVIRTDFRQGDGAEMALIEFVDFNTEYSANSSASDDAAKSKRRRRGGKAKTAATVVAGTAAAAAVAAAAPALAADEAEVIEEENIAEEEE